jgi:hypothetical protein
MKLIPLTKGYSAMVDDEDYERLIQYKWHVAVHQAYSHLKVYAKRGIKKDGKWTSIGMHRVILGCEGSIDHKDDNGLNNQRANLRPASRSQQMANSRKRPGAYSPYRGVSWNKHNGYWQAAIRKGDVLYNLGSYRDDFDAALAYNLKADELFGEFARFNTPILTNNRPQE